MDQRLTWSKYWKILQYQAGLLSSYRFTLPFSIKRKTHFSVTRKTTLLCCCCTDTCIIFFLFSHSFAISQPFTQPPVLFSISSRSVVSFSTLVTHLGLWICMDGYPPFCQMASCIAFADRHVRMKRCFLFLLFSESKCSSQLGFDKYWGSRATNLIQFQFLYNFLIDISFFIRHGIKNQEITIHEELYSNCYNVPLRTLCVDRIDLPFLSLTHFFSLNLMAFYACTCKYWILSQQDHNVNALVSAPPKEEKKTGWVKQEEGKRFHQPKQQGCTFYGYIKVATDAECMAKCEATYDGANAVTVFRGKSCYCYKCQGPATYKQHGQVSYFKPT